MDDAVVLRLYAVVSSVSIRLDPSISVF